jgi:hypothetical protein
MRPPSHPNHQLSGHQLVYAVVSSTPSSWPPPPRPPPPRPPSPPPATYCGGPLWLTRTTPPWPTPPWPTPPTLTRSHRLGCRHLPVSATVFHCRGVDTYIFAQKGAKRHRRAQNGTYINQNSTWTLGCSSKLNTYWADIKNIIFSTALRLALSGVYWGLKSSRAQKTPHVPGFRLVLCEP